MKRFQSILCASLLTLAMSSAALAGDIYGRTGSTATNPGDIYGRPSNTSTNPGDIYRFTDEAYSALLGLFTVIIP